MGVRLPRGVRAASSEAQSNRLLTLIHRWVVGLGLNPVVCLDRGVARSVGVGDGPIWVIGLFLWVFRVEGRVRVLC